MQPTKLNFLASLLVGLCVSSAVLASPPALDKRQDDLYKRGGEFVDKRQDDLFKRGGEYVDKRGEDLD